ncbi:type II toxin-antitoxin system RelE family toxin [Planktothrix agardhii]
MNHLKKLQGYDTFYRIRLGNYRIGIELNEDTIIFTRFLHRKDIYKFFP